MINRSKYLTMFTVLIGLILLSIGFNIILIRQIKYLQYGPPVSDKELKELMKEVKRLSSVKYDIKTRKVIDGFKIYTK